VRPVQIVVIDVLAKDQPQVPLAGDQYPVQALTAGAGDPAFRDRVRPRRPDWSLDNPHPGGDEHRIERYGELGIPVPEQEFETVSIVLKVHQQVPGLLGHPLPRRMSGDPVQMHPPGAVLDEEQRIQAAKECRIDVEEVDGEDRLGLSGQECPPGLPGTLGCGVDARVVEDLPDRRRRDLVPEAVRWP
jgi:hypothetical protein